MASTLTAVRYPKYKKELRALAAQHKELKDEPLHLAVAYDPGRDREDMFLFEIIGRLETGEPNPEKELFEVTFQSSPAYEMPFEGRLHLILTSPQEFQEAVAKRWKLAGEFSKAVKRGDFAILHSDKVGRKMMQLVQG